jgi:hypothetical protein
MYNGGGIGVIDMNKDGLQDLIFVGNKVLTRAYLNLGNLKFKDITDNFKGLSNKYWLNGISVVDINADGWDDIYLTSNISMDSTYGENQLWVNQGPGTDGVPKFTEMAKEFGIDKVGYSIHTAFFDYDLDGDLDMYALNNIVNDKVPTNFRPKIVDGTAINNDKLFRNEGDGKFVDVTMDAGISYEGFGLGLALGDVNKDGYPDIYVSNDYISNDLFYVNQGNGTFKDMAPYYFPYQSRFSMGNDMADINNDGGLDIMTLDMLPEEYFRKKQTINGNSYQIYSVNKQLGYQNQHVRNMLFQHNGFLNGDLIPFSEVGQILGIYETEWSWSPLFADFDNDGDKDLMVTNGFPRDLTDKDFSMLKAKMYGYLAGDDDMLPKIPTVKVSNYAFEHTGDSRFENKTFQWGMSTPSFSNGAVFVDLDNDGDLDYVTNNINDKAFVYRNNTNDKEETRQNFLRLSLKGNGLNTHAIGAKVELWAGGQMQYQENFHVRGYMSSVDPVLHFGLGKITVVDSIRVIWPTGKISTLMTQVKVNQVLVVDEKEAKPFDFEVWRQRLNANGSLFRRVESGLDYTHYQEDYVDFFMNQKTILHKLSQVGPCMAKGDINGDGEEDIYIGGSTHDPATVFLKQGANFKKADIIGLSEKRSCQESDAAIADFDDDGDNDIVLISGGYYTENEKDYRHFLYLNNEGVFQKVELPIPAFAASVVRPLDYDKDGDIDIFIGARVTRGNYPMAPKSFLLLNNKGNFSPDRVTALELGMVTDAVWSDSDGDGWQDLLVAREWNSVVLLRNAPGKDLTDATPKELEAKHGFWSAIHAVDLDGDGDDDYILGNLGDNHRFRISEQYPMRMYSLDLDGDKSIDPFPTAYWKDKDGKMQEYPVHYLDELAAQSEFFRKKFKSYTEFSYKTVSEILDKRVLNDKNRLWINTTPSFVVWNEGKSFTLQQLPAVVQYSPIKKIFGDDLNKDGVMDIILTGNDYSYDVSTGNFDSNKGVILLGRKDRKFDYVPASVSGMLINGQVEALLLLKGNPSLLVAGINRGKVLTFEQVSTSK